MLKTALIQTIPPGQSKPQIGIGIAYLQSYIEAHEPDVKVDLYVNTDGFQEVFEPLDYDLVGISSVSFCLNDAIDIARNVKSKDANIPILLGGSHISGFPRSITNEFFDIGVVGEGEITFLELVKLLKADGEFRKDRLLGVKGVCFTKNGEFISTGYHDYIEDLDRIPPFDKSFLKKYNMIPFTAMSRGCPFKCTYCNSRLTWQGKLRMFSPDYIIQDILELKMLYPDDRRIVFRDDTFTVNKKALEEIHHRIDEITADKDISFIGSTHPNFITHESAKILKSIGVKKLNFGIETGSNRLLRIVKRNSTSIARVQQALDICYEHDIKVGSSFIIGFPEETEADLRQSYEFIIENMKSGRLFTTGTLILTPLPAEESDYWRLAVRKYDIDYRTFDWSRLDFRSWHLYYFENNQEGSIHDWWAWREKEQKALFLGAIKEDKWLKIIEPYEIEMREMNLINSQIDRSAWK